MSKNPKIKFANHHQIVEKPVTTTICAAVWFEDGMNIWLTDLIVLFSLLQLLSSDDLWMYAPLAYNGMDIGLDLKINMINDLGR